MGTKAVRGAVLALALFGVACGSSSKSNRQGGKDGGGDGAAPAGPLASRCTDAIDTLYQVPSGLPPFSQAVRGEVLGCAPYATYSKDEVVQRLSSVPGAVVNSGALYLYVIAYRTAREPATVGAISTAFVILPEHLMAPKVPLVLAAHGTVGVANKCAPTRGFNDPSFFPLDYMNAMLLAWAARGLPVVVPDYAGLGTPGIHDYSNWYDPARSAIDGLRALHSMLPASELDGTALVYGHSQGGGVALTVAAIENELPDIKLSAVVSMAPAWRLSITYSDIVVLSSVPLTPILRTAGALLAYSAIPNLTSDSTQFGAMFNPAIRAPMVDRVTSLCFNDLMQSVDTPAAGYVPPATVGDLVDPTFVQQVSACKSGGDCTTLGGKFYQRDAADEPHLSSSSPPVLIVGSKDDEQAPIGEVGCVIQRAAQDGAPLDVCIQSGFKHLAVVNQLDTYSIDWALAAASGASRPACTGDQTHPACSPF